MLFVMLVIFLILKNTVLLVLSAICKSLWSCICGSDNLKSGNKCPCIYKEYPIIDLIELYKKASRELQRYTDMGEVEMTEISKKRNEDEAAFDYANTK
jgi:hypothetical protein